jgi:hypothetical protein
LPPPDAAIPPEEDATSITTAGMLRATFAQQDERVEAQGVAALLDALVSLLSGSERMYLLVIDVEPLIPEMLCVPWRLIGRRHRADGAVLGVHHSDALD